jgi:hypothetical protein
MCGGMPVQLTLSGVVAKKLAQETQAGGGL